MRGLLGWDAPTSDCPAPGGFAGNGHALRIETVDSGDPHPNTYRLTLTAGGSGIAFEAISTGGDGEVVTVDDFPVSIAGATTRRSSGWSRNDPDLLHRLSGILEADAILLHASATGHLVEIKAQRFLDDRSVAVLSPRRDPTGQTAAPVLPVLSRRGPRSRFTRATRCFGSTAGGDAPLWRHAWTTKWRVGTAESESSRDAGDRPDPAPVHPQGLARHLSWRPAAGYQCVPSASVRTRSRR